MDATIALWINHLGHGTLLDMFSFTLSRWPFLVLVLWIVIVLSYRRKAQQRNQYLVALCIGMILFYVVNELVFKHLIVQYTGIRLRPYLASPGDIFAIGNQLLDSSFPSSHVASSLVILTLFVRRLPKRWIRAAGIALLVGLSRIHNGMHYPTDVLAGTVLWIIYAITAIRASKHIIQRRPSLNHK